MGSEDCKTGFGDRLKALRKNKKWTQEDFADIMGVDRRTISKWESYYDLEEAELKTKNLMGICINLECDIEYLIGQIDTPRKETADVQATLGISSEAVLAIQEMHPRMKAALAALVMDHRFVSALRKYVTALSLANGENIPLIFQEEWEDFQNIQKGAAAWGAYVLPRDDAIDYYIADAGHDFVEALKRILDGGESHGNG